MIEYPVLYQRSVESDFEAIARFITANSTLEHAERYVRKLRQEIDELSHLASVLPESRWQIPKYFHPRAKVLHTHNKKWSVIFHMDGGKVIVDRLIPSSLIID